MANGETKKLDMIDDDQLDDVTGGTSMDGDVSLPAARRCRLCRVGMTLFTTKEKQFWKCPKCGNEIEITSV